MLAKNIFFVVTLCVLSLPSNAATIDFENDPVGAFNNGFESSDALGVSFSDPITGAISINDLESISGSKQLDGAGGSKGPLLINFEFLVSFISLDFGNDEPRSLSPGENFELTAYLGTTIIGTSSVIPNLNDLTDQTIVFSGAIFDAVSLDFNKPSRKPAVVIDNITFVAASPPPVPGSRPPYQELPSVNAIPLPASAFLLSAALFGFGVFARRFREA